MHGQGIVHGALKGVRLWMPCHCPVDSLPSCQANILIDHSRQARLADFSLSATAPDQQTTINSWIESGSIPWMSPELLRPDKFGSNESRPTEQSDCYALGMVVYEVIGGQTPFGLEIAPGEVIQMVLEDKRPERPRTEEGKLLTDDIWGVLERCWKHRPTDRASLEDVLKGLERNPILGTFLPFYFGQWASI